METRSTLLLALLFVFEGVWAGSFSSPNVKAVSTKNFDKIVLGSEKATVAALYVVLNCSNAGTKAKTPASFAPWCGHCQRLAPEYENAARNMKGLVNYVAIDCDEQSNKALCGQYGIQGFPTLKLFPGKPRTSPRDYNGPRTAKDLADYSAEQMPSHVKKAKTSQDILKLVDESRTKPVAILFTSASLVTPLYKGLSTDFHNDMDLYAVRDTPDITEAKTRLGITKTPTLVVLRPGRSEAEAYKGAKFNYDLLHAFLSRFAKEAQTRSEL